MSIPRKPRIRLPDFPRPTTENLRKAVDTLVDAVDEKMKQVTREKERILEPLQARLLHTFELCEEILRTHPKKIPLFVTFLSGMLHTLYVDIEYLYQNREPLQHVLGEAAVEITPEAPDLQKAKEDALSLKHIAEQNLGSHINTLLFPREYFHAKYQVQEYQQTAPEKRTPLPLSFAIETGERFFKGVSVENFEAGKEKIRSISEKARVFSETFATEHGRAPTVSEEYDAVFAKHLGTQNNDQNSAYILATTGEGNCQARAELYLLFLEARAGKALDQAYFNEHAFSIDTFNGFQTLTGDRFGGHIEVSLLVQPNTVSVFGGKRSWFDSTARRTQDNPLSVYSETLARAFFPEEYEKAESPFFSPNFTPPIHSRFTSDGGSAAEVAIQNIEQSQEKAYPSSLSDSDNSLSDLNPRTLRSLLHARYMVAEEEAKKTGESVSDIIVKDKDFARYAQQLESLTWADFEISDAKLAEHALARQEYVALLDPKNPKSFASFLRKYGTDLSSLRSGVVYEPLFDNPEDKALFSEYFSSLQRLSPDASLISTTLYRTEAEYFSHRSLALSFILNFIPTEKMLLEKPDTFTVSRIELLEEILQDPTYLRLGTHTHIRLYSFSPEEFSRYERALLTFKTEYGSLPHDMISRSISLQERLDITSLFSPQKPWVHLRTFGLRFTLWQGFFGNLTLQPGDNLTLVDEGTNESLSPALTIAGEPGKTPTQLALTQIANDPTPTRIRFLHHARAIMDQKDMPSLILSTPNRNTCAESVVLKHVASLRPRFINIDTFCVNTVEIHADAFPVMRAQSFSESLRDFSDVARRNNPHVRIVLFLPITNPEERSEIENIFRKTLPDTISLHLTP